MSPGNHEVITLSSIAPACHSAAIVAHPVSTRLNQQNVSSLSSIENTINVGSMIWVGEKVQLDNIIFRLQVSQTYSSSIQFLSNSNR